MPRSCKCGGALRPWYETARHFAVKCDKCGVIHRQKKRQPREDEEDDE